MKKILSKLFIVFVILLISKVYTIGQVRATETTSDTTVTAENTVAPTQNATSPKNTTPEKPASEDNTDSNTNTNSNTNKTKTNTTAAQSTTKPSNVDKSSDCYLKSLKVGEGTLSPVFSKDVVSYKVKFPSNYDFSTLKEIKIEAQANDSKATVTGAGVRGVNGEGITNLAITVKAENGQEKIYTVTIEKPKDLSLSDLKLTSLNVDKKGSNGILSSLTFSPTFDENTLEYSADVDDDITAVVVYAKSKNGINVEIEGADSDGCYDLSGGKNTIYITLTSDEDDSLVTNYKLTINKPETEEESIAESDIKAKKKEHTIVPIVIGIIAVLACLLIVLMVINHKQKKENADDDEDEDEDEDDDEIEDTKDEDEVKEKAKAKKSKVKKGKRFAD